LAGSASRLLVEYDGTDFAGWARQPGARTIQGELERALAVVLRREAPLTVAGRTDAGVHAVAQVASHPGTPAPSRSLNALLPADVAVLASAAAAAGFDARRDATSRAYRYRLLVREVRSPFERRVALHWPYGLDRGALHACAAQLPGAHDFTAFTPTQTDHVHFIRRVRSARWEADPADPGRLEFVIEADAFMRHMVRVLVGTMLEAASGRRHPDSFAELLGGRSRSAAGPTAPPHGLTLIGVGYTGAPVVPGIDHR
jgi:tRNA pseudouridine38-40 synthase